MKQPHFVHFMGGHLLQGDSYLQKAFSARIISTFSGKATCLAWKKVSFRKGSGVLSEFLSQVILFPAPRDRRRGIAKEGSTTPWSTLWKGDDSCPSWSWGLKTMALSDNPDLHPARTREGPDWVMCVALFAKDFNRGKKAWHNSWIR